MNQCESQLLSGIVDVSFEIAPALFRKMQAEPPGDVLAETEQLRVGYLAGHGFLEIR